MDNRLSWRLISMWSAFANQADALGFIVGLGCRRHFLARYRSFAKSPAYDSSFNRVCRKIIAGISPRCVGVYRSALLARSRIDVVPCSG